jgi:hypothetical protein
MFQYDGHFPVGGVCGSNAADHRQHKSSSALHANGKYPKKLKRIMLNTGRKSGFAGSHDVQVFGWLRIDHSAFSSDYEKGLDEPATLGRIYEMCKDHCSGQLFRPYAIAPGAAQGDPG